MKTQIPIYRAKKIDSDEYVEGYLVELWTNQGNKQRYAIDLCEVYDAEENSIYAYQIDPSTLAIHFPDMIDSEGTKIFASLSEDGKGGDTMSFDTDNHFVIKYSKGEILLTYKKPLVPLLEILNLKVTGIQE